MGYKLFTVASDGYLLGFRIYRGKGGYEQPQSVLHRTVIDLVRPWTGADRTLYMDNLYTSPDLCRHLLELQTLSCGTCRPNRRGLPTNIKKIKDKLDKDEMKSWASGQLGCLVWNDSKPVIFLSTHRRVDQLTSIPAGKGRPAHRRPTIAVEYNYNKGHVDQVDQLRSYYMIVERRGRRSWPALAWWLLDMCIGNAYKLWCLRYNAKPGMLHFREQLLLQIAAAYPSHRTHVQPEVPAARRPRTIGHYPKRTHRQRQCVQCSAAGKGRVRTEVECEVCGEHLCIDPLLQAVSCRAGAGWLIGMSLVCYTLVLTEHRGIMSARHPKATILARGLERDAVSSVEKHSAPAV